jgi:predicted CXXCH cytochrome family protein
MLSTTFEFTSTGFILALLLSGDLSIQDELGYVGSDTCCSCHATQDPETVRNWQISLHAAASALYGSEEGNTLLLIGSGTAGSVRVATDLRVEVVEGTQLETTFPPHDQLAVQGAAVDAGQTCLGCHTTGYSILEKNYSEPGVGCEACHGPGRKHVDSGGLEGTIVNPSKLSADRNRMVCGQCHSLGFDPSGKHPFPVSGGKAPFLPGEDLNVAFIDSKPVTTFQGGEYSTFVNSPEPYSDQLCTDCHNPHGNEEAQSMLVDPSSTLCKRCHSNPLSGIDQVDEESHWGADRHNCWECHDYAHLH